MIQLSGYGQFGYGITMNNDIYHRYTNPLDSTGASRSAGSALLNLSVGPKIWIGGPKFSISAEAQAGIGFLGLALKDYKGLGTASFPILVKLNFKGLSSFEKEGMTGFSIGGGIQYSKTELYGLSDKFESKGVERKLFKTYVVQAGYGFGLSGFAVSGFLKYGWNADTKANLATLGIQWDFNLPMTNKISNPTNEL
jgi:hypothetical protein